MTWRTLLPHELDEVEKKIEAGEALDVGLLRSLVTMARDTSEKTRGYEVGYESGWEEGYDDGHHDGYDKGYDAGYRQ